MPSQGPSSHQTNDVHNHNHERIDNNGEFGSSDGILLEELANRASRYSINLNGFVSKDNAFYSRGGYAMVWSGILDLKRAKEVIGRIGSSDFLGDGETVKVNLHLNHTLA